MSNYWRFFVNFDLKEMNVHESSTINWGKCFQIFLNTLDLSNSCLWLLSIFCNCQLQRAVSIISNIKNGEYPTFHKRYPKQHRRQSYQISVIYYIYGAPPTVPQGSQVPPMHKCQQLRSSNSPESQNLLLPLHHVCRLLAQGFQWIKRNTDLVCILLLLQLSCSSKFTIDV
jgi:hypothetical protein